MIESPLLRSLREAAPTVSVGMMTADLLNLGSEIALLETSGVKLVHFDVMDGCFCPMLTIGPPIVKAVETRLLKDVHLMITDPLAMRPIMLRLPEVLDRHGLRCTDCARRIPRR